MTAIAASAMSRWSGPSLTSPPSIRVVGLLGMLALILDLRQRRRTAGRV